MLNQLGIFFWLHFHHHSHTFLISCVMTESSSYSSFWTDYPSLSSFLSLLFSIDLGYYLYRPPSLMHQMILDLPEKRLCIHYFWQCPSHHHSTHWGHSHFSQNSHLLFPLIHISHDVYVVYQYKERSVLESFKVQDCVGLAYYAWN